MSEVNVSFNEETRMYKLKAKCKLCGRELEVDMTEEQMFQWRRGECVQFIFPHMSVDERELLISGFCGSCFDRIFAED